MLWTSMKARWLAAGLGVALVAPAARAVEPGTYIVAVSLKDIDLASKDGQKIARHRVASAAKEVCREADMSTDDNCREAALKDAVVQVHQLEAQALALSSFAAN
jgi:UrcA family protein